MLTTTFVVAGLIEILLPFVVGIWFWKKYGASWKVFFIGVLAFAASQLVHLPLLYLVDWLASSAGISETWSAAALLGLNAIVLGLLSGLCEEVARWFSFKLMKADGDNFRSALMLGAGHGGIESFLVGFSVIASAISLILWMNGSFPTTNLPAETIGAYQQLAQMSWHMPLLGAFERIAAVTLHLSLSSLVWMAYHYRKLVYLLLAILWHATVNGVVVYLGGLGWDPIALEAVMAFVMLVSIGFIVIIKRKYGQNSLYDASKLPDTGPLQDAS